MGFSDNKITAPISISDVATALGENNLDVGALCSSPKVKAWAKYKPVKDDSPITKDGWWDGNNGKCGFSIPTFGGTTGNFYSDNMVGLFTEDGVNGWNYDQPKAGDWLRLTDFEGYYSLASAPFGPQLDITIEKGEKSSITINPKIGANTRDDVLNLADFGLFYNPKTDEAIYHFGAFIVGYNNGTRQYKRVISDLKDNNNKPIIGSTVNIPVGDLPVGTYTIYCILANQPIGYNAETGLADIDMSVAAVPCPGVAPATLIIADKQEPYLLTASYTVSESTSGLQPSFTFKNQSNHNVQIKNITAKYLLGGDWNNVASSASWGSGVITVEMNSSYSPNPNLSPGIIKPSTGGGADVIGIELTVVVLNSSGNPTGETIKMQAVSAIIFNPAGNINPLNE